MNNFRRCALLLLAILGCAELHLLAAEPLEAPVDVRRPAAIRTSEVPVIPEDLVQRLSRYDNMRAAGFAGWAPHGDGMVIQTRFGNSVQMHRVYEPGGRREQITFFEEPVGGTFIPEAEDNALLLTLSAGGSENTQIYLHDPDDHRTKLLTDGTSRNGLGPIRDDGSRMVVSSNRRNGRDTDLYLANPRKPGSMEMLYEVSGEFWYAADWSADGKWISLIRYVSANESYPARMNVDDRELRPLPTVGKEPASYGAAQFALDGKSVYLTTDARGEFSELARLDLKTGEYTWLTADIPWDVEEVEVDPATGRVALVTNEDGASKLYLLDGDKRRELPVPLGIVSDLEFPPEGSRLGLTLARSDLPADAYSLDLASGELTRWTFSELGGLDPKKFVEPERIAFESFDGREIPAYYYRPAGASADKPAAVVIDIHGGPEGQYRPYFSSTTQFYVSEMGIAVIAPNVRGSAGYGKTYLKLDDAELREDSVKDIGALLDWIAEQPELDASRVAVAGGSYGGYMVLASLVHYPDRIRAGVDVVGIANFITFLERTAAYRQDLRRVEYGDERDPEMRAVFERINPTSHADRIRAALLVAHGDNDPRVPLFEAEQIAQKVREQGRPVWTIFADNEGHGFAKKENRDYLRAAIVLFFEQYLQPEGAAAAE